MSAIQDGEYQAVAQPVDTLEGPVFTQFGYSKDNARQVAVIFQITEGEYKGRKLTWFGSFKSAKSSEFAIKALRACGFTGENLDTIFDQQLDNVVTIVVANEEYDGKMNTKVKWVNSGGGGFKHKKPMSRDDLKGLSKQIRKVVAGVPDVQGVKLNGQPSGSAPAGTVETDEFGNPLF